MNYKLTKAEQETIILFDEDIKKATVYTHNSKLKQQLSDLAAKRSTEIKQTKNNKWGGLTYELPKTWLKIRPTRIISEQEQKKRADQLKRNLSKKPSIIIDKTLP
jgi:hypothetical protein